MPPNFLVPSHNAIALSMAAMCRLPLDDRLFFISSACLPFQRAALRRVGPPYSIFCPIGFKARTPEDHS